MTVLAAIEQTALSVWVREATTLWAFPFILFLHTLGLGFLVGINVAVNLWILGFAHRHPIAPMQQLIPIMWLGFIVNAISGCLLLIAYPTKALTDPVFYIKIALIMTAVFLLQWTDREVFVKANPERVFEPRKKVRRVAIITLALWSGAILTGRLLAYTYNILMASDVLS